MVFKKDEVESVSETNSKFLCHGLKTRICSDLGVLIELEAQYGATFYVIGFNNNVT